MITPQESKAIDSIRFTCIIFLILLHTQVSHLTIPPVTDKLMKIQEFINIPFLSILFLLSGYLFFLNIDLLTSRKDWLSKIWPNKLQKRIKTLLIPYILWCCIALLYNYFIKGIELPQNIPNFIMQFWDAGSNTGYPIGKAMWYIKSLIVFSILSPVYFYFIKWCKHLILIVIIFLIPLDLRIDYPYFNIYLLLGSYLALMGFTLEKLTSIFNWKICLLFLIISKTTNFLINGLVIPTFFNFAFCLVILLGLYLKYNLKSSLVVTCSFLYFSHPYFTGLRNIYMNANNNNGTLQSFLIWILTTISVIIICILLFSI